VGWQRCSAGTRFLQFPLLNRPQGTGIEFPGFTSFRMNRDEKLFAVVSQHFF
jgi:hypothetical protein